MKKPALACIFLLFSGCADPSPLTNQQREELTAEGNRPVTCSAGSDCDLKWGRAINWVKLLPQNDYYDLTLLNASEYTIKVGITGRRESWGDWIDYGWFNMDKIATSPGVYTIHSNMPCYDSEDTAMYAQCLEEKADFVTYVQGAPSRFFSDSPAQR